MVYGVARERRFCSGHREDRGCKRLFSVIAVGLVLDENEEAAKRTYSEFCTALNDNAVGSDRVGVGGEIFRKSRGVGLGVLVLSSYVVGEGSAKLLGVLHNVIGGLVSLKLVLIDAKENVYLQLLVAPALVSLGKTVLGVISLVLGSELVYHLDRRVLVVAFVTFLDKLDALLGNSEMEVGGEVDVPSESLGEERECYVEYDYSRNDKRGDGNRRATVAKLTAC